MRKSRGEAADIKGAGDHGDARVKLAPKQQRHVVAQDVAQTRRAAGDHARHDNDEERKIEIERDIAADHREHDEADRVENKKDVAQPMHDARDCDRQQRRAAVTAR